MPIASAAPARSADPIPAGLPGLWQSVSETDLTTGEVSLSGNAHTIITRTHMMSLGGAPNRPKLAKRFYEMTAAEVLSQLPAGGSFMSHAIVNGKIHRTVIFALSAYFEGMAIETEYELTNDTLILRDAHSADGHLREWRLRRVAPAG